MLYPSFTLMFERSETLTFVASAISLKEGLRPIRSPGTAHSPTRGKA